MTRSRRRRGFTLMEVMTAITITALVATVAAAALRAGLDVRERVNMHRTTVDAEARAFEWIGTMLRHPPEASAVNEPLLQISPAPNGGDSVIFLSRGVSATAGVGAIWRVSMNADSDGLHIRAESTRDASLARMESLLPHIRTLRVEALSSAQSGQWSREWPVLRSVPAALRMTFGLDGGVTRAPLVFPTSLSLAGSP